MMEKPAEIETGDRSLTFYVLGQTTACVQITTTEVAWPAALMIAMIMMAVTAFLGSLLLLHRYLSRK